MIGRTLLSFAISTVAIAVAFLLWALPAPSAQRGYVWGEIALVLLWVSPFTALGLLLLMPMAWLSIRRTPAPAARFAALVAAGGVLGTLLLLPLTEMPTFDLLIGTAAGAFTAGTWAFLNQSRLARAVATRR